MSEEEIKERLFKCTKFLSENHRSNVVCIGKGENFKKDPKCYVFYGWAISIISLEYPDYIHRISSFGVLGGDIGSRFYFAKEDSMIAKLNKDRWLQIDQNVTKVKLIL